MEGHTWVGHTGAPCGAQGLTIFYGVVEVHSVIIYTCGAVVDMFAGADLVFGSNNIMVWSITWIQGLSKCAFMQFDCAIRHVSLFLLPVH